MAVTKSIQFLPEVFRTDTNKKFLNATVDQLISEPQLKKINGYIGRKLSPSYKALDNYILETEAERQNYQLEPSLVVKDPITNKIEFTSTYNDLINQIAYYGGFTNKHDRLFESEYYSYDPKIDFDKLINFNQYYWLENGPSAITVSAAGVPLNYTFNVVYNSVNKTYSFTGQDNIPNPIITLARGGTYDFVVNDPGFPLYIQGKPGVAGTDYFNPNINTRDIVGVTNNGTDFGVIRFKVPLENSQDNFNGMPLAGTADYATDLSFKDVQGANPVELIDRFGGIDGPAGSLDNKYIIFVNNNLLDEEFWNDAPPVIVNGVVQFNYYDMTSYDLDSSPYDQVEFVEQGKKNDIYQIQILPDYAGIDRIVLSPVIAVENNQKVRVRAGNVYSGKEFYSVGGIFNIIPYISSTLDTLYYQNGTVDDAVGIIKIINPVNDTIDPDLDIIGKTNYTSPRGIIFTNGLKITFDTTATQPYQGKTYYVEGVGKAIRLVYADNLTSYELDNNLGVQDYITINRGSIDNNAWSRTNRWFHSDVILKTAEYLDLNPVFDQTLRAKRPIIEFEADLQLYNFGTLAKAPVQILDNIITNAYTQVQGVVCLSTTSHTFTVDGNSVTLTNGDRVVFSIDENNNVRNKIYNFSIVQESVAPDPVVYKAYIVESEDTLVEEGHVIVVEKGVNGKKQWHYNGNNWILAQQKTSVNQPPLFDIIDANGASLAGTSTYPGSSFTGNKIFSYAVGVGENDEVLGFPLSYKNFVAQGDIEFVNNFDTDTFEYTTTAGTSGTVKTNSGLIQKNINRTTSIRQNIWTIADNFSKQFQIFTFTYTGESNLFPIDDLPEISVNSPNIKVAVNNRFIPTQDFALTQLVDRYCVSVNTDILTVNDSIFVLLYNSLLSFPNAYYEIPSNLDINGLNQNLSKLTLGQMRNHLIALKDKSLEVVGDVPGNSNLRDLTIKNKGGNVLQQSAPIVYSNLFLTHPTYNFVNALKLASQEYTKFKIKFLELAANLDLDRTNIAGSVDTILGVINDLKTNLSPWYYSDMVPYSAMEFNALPTYQVLSPAIRSYEITNIFQDTILQNKAVLVYLTRTVNSESSTTLLVKDIDFYFDQTRPAIVFNDSFTLLYDDRIDIIEYSNTNGSYVPETPTKLGLYPKFKPEIFLDTTYRTPINVIQGHDGSITPCFDDYRDKLLLELERRIYNNLKVTYNPNNFNLFDYLPGKFRNTSYTNAEFNQLLSNSFLSWVGSNKVDYTTNNTFSSSDAFTWNYKKFRDVINGESLPGSWRSIYKYFYDTDRPHTHPWEMLGFSEKPSYWDDRYGPAPYTGGNAVLWSDLSQGYIHSGSRAGFDIRYRRPNLSLFVPVDESGNLVSPEKILVVDFSSDKANTSYAVGDIGPVENAWRKSSDYPFALQMALALAKPAKYFSLLSNLTNYYRNEVTAQFLIESTGQHITPQSILINGYESLGTIQRSAGYLNWIVDYVKNLGINDAAGSIKNTLDKMSVQLCYKMAGFSDQKFITLLAEQSSPTSINDSIVIPDENYRVELFKGAPIDKVQYSAVIIEKSSSGYTVSGYSTVAPYFFIIPSLQNNNSYTIKQGNSRGIIYKDFKQSKLTIPYGFEFNTKQQVIDFLVSYQRFLQSQGFVFTDIDLTLNEKLDWILSAKEFLHWADQGWRSGSLLVLSPVKNSLKYFNLSATVDEVKNSPFGSKILDINNKIIKKNNFSVYRENSLFEIRATKDQSIGFAELNIVQFEHILILDNQTVFNDIIYAPELGNRQFRIRLLGSKTDLWNGSLELPGFMYSSPVIDPWMTGKDYLKGTIVEHKRKYYTALQNIIAADKFDTTNWKLITSGELNFGMINNFSTNAGQSLQFYDIDNQPYNEEIQILSDGLIGFRDRKFFSDLGIDTTTQSKFYQGLIKQKGTINAVSALKGAKFNNINTDINVYENWAVRVGEYGSIDDNQYIEIALDEQKVTNNPTPLQFIDSSVIEEADIVSYEFQDLYKISGDWSANIFRTKSIDFTDDLIPLPTAGFVYQDDINSTLFDLNEYAQLNSKLDEIGTGWKLWVAKNIQGQWDVFRANNVKGVTFVLKYYLDNLAEIIHNQPHYLNVDDIIVLKNFDDRFNGVYKVKTIIDSTRFTVEMYQNLDTLRDLEIVIGEGLSGLLFQLASMKINYTTEIESVKPQLGWNENDKVWVNNLDFDGNWGVYSKGDPWTFDIKLNLNESQYKEFDHFGSVISLDASGLVMYSAAPDSGQTAVFQKNTITNEWVLVATLFTKNTNVEKLGNSLSNGNNFLAVGSSISYSDQGVVFIYKDQILQQILLDVTGSSGDEFGYSSAMSDDGRFLYIGAPGANKIYCYGLAPVRDGGVASYNGDGVTDTFTLPAIASNPTEIVIVNILTAEELIPVKDYTISQTSNSVDSFTFTGTPPSTLGLNFNVSATGGTGSGAKFDVAVVLEGPGAGVGLTVGKIYKIASAGTTDFVALGSADNNPGTVFIATASGVSPGVPFTTGTAYKCDILLTNAGSGYTINDTLTILGGSIGGVTPTNNQTVTVTNVTSGTNITFVSIPTSGQQFSAFARPYYYKLLDTIPLAAEVVASSRFGTSLATNSSGSVITVGAPNELVNSTSDSGSIYVYHRTIYEFITDGISGTYNIPNSFGSVRSVTLNNNLLIENVDYYIVGTTSIQFAPFQTPAKSLKLIVEANSFIFDQKFSSIVGENYNFGEKIELCATGCNIVTTVPNYNKAGYQVGAVVRLVNVGRVYGQVLGNREFSTNINAEDILANFAYRIVELGDTDFVSIGASPSAVVSGSISGTVLTVTAISSGTVTLDTFITATGILPSTKVLEQITATNTASATVAATGTSGNNFFTVASLSGILVGQFVSGASIPSNSYVTSINSGTSTIFISNNLSGPLAATVNFYTKGSTGTYLVNVAQTLAATSISFQPIVDQVFRATGPANGTGKVANAVYPSDSLNINNVEIQFISSSLESVVNIINAANIPGITATNFKNKLKIDSRVVIPGQKLDIKRGSGTALEDLGLELYATTQLIIHPNSTGEFFGSSIGLNADSDVLAIGSSGGDITVIQSVDNKTTTFDSGSTLIVDFIKDSGSVYIYDLLDNPFQSIENPSVFVLSQELYAPELTTGIEFGKAIKLNNNSLFVGVSKDNEFGRLEAGSIYNFVNNEELAGWQLIRYKKPRVDTDAINSVFTYDTDSLVIQNYFDFIDPAKGKILGIADQEIDYREIYDPASYNTTSNSSFTNSSTFYWTDRHVGKTWWDLSLISYIDYEQESLTFRSKNWGEFFPGSQVKIYEWVESTLLPSQYVAAGGDGIPKYSDNSAYSSVITVDPETGIIVRKYYYWVGNKTSVNPVITKRQLSIKSLETYITNPKDTGIPYIALLSPNSLSVYNGSGKLKDNKIILHLDLGKSKNQNLIHSEYQLIQEGNGTEIFPNRIIDKLRDSLAGFDRLGSLVPDVALNVQDRYGILFKPRQAIFIDRIAALTTFVKTVNNTLYKFPVLLTTTPTSLYAEEPVPSSGYDAIVDSFAELSYLDAVSLPNGFKVLIPQNSDYQNKWTLYEFNSTTQSFDLVKIQPYKTPLFWTSVDWYAEDYNIGSKIDYIVQTYGDTLSLSLEVGDLIKVLDNGNGQWLIYEVNDALGFNLKGAQNSTLYINQDVYDVTLGPGFDSTLFEGSAFDPQIGTEFVSIFESLYNEILVKDLSIEFNKLFFTMINYLFSEQKMPDWIFKTSLIDVYHNLRKLEQIPNYIKDDQTFYENYINEIKPYRTKLRDYLPIYDSIDYAVGDWTDFDLPSVYDKTTNTYAAPTDLTVIANTTSYSEWYNHYTYKVTSFLVGNVGLGYTIAPNVEITGGGGSGATAIATINPSTQKLTGVFLTNPGSGYTTTPTVTINGVGTSAVVYPLLTNEYYTPSPANSYNLIRSIDSTIKFDRIMYRSNVVPWVYNAANIQIQPTVISGNAASGNLWITSGNIISYNNEAFLLNQQWGTAMPFDFTKVTKLDAGNVLLRATDRINIFYQPKTGMPGQNFNELMTGIDYSGVKVTAAKFTANSFEISSNILSFNYNGLTITSANVEIVDFQKLGFELNETIRISANYNFDFKNNGYFKIISVDNDYMRLSGEVIETTYRMLLDNPVTVYKGNIITQANTTGNAYVLQDAYNSRFIDIIHTTTGFQQTTSIATNAETFNIVSVGAAEKIYINNVITSANIQEIYTGGNTDVTISYLELDSYILDSNIFGNTYLDTSLGTKPEDINITGGLYIDGYNSHAPEELVPGRMFDTLEMRVFTNNSSNTATYGFRIFNPMDTEPVFTRISANATTTLASNLFIDDNHIELSNVNNLPYPNPAAGIPGVVFVNGEKIHYYQKYTVTDIASATAWTANTAFALDSLVNVDLGRFYANVQSNVIGVNFNIRGYRNNYYTELSFSNVEVTIGNVYSITGNLLGGITPTNDLEIQIATDGTEVFYNSIGTPVTPESTVYRVIGNINAIANSAINTANLTLARPNSLAQLLRGVSGTGVPEVHQINSKVVDSSIDQLIPQASVYSNIAANIISGNANVTSNVSYRLTVYGNVSVKIGDYITQANNISGNARVLANVSAETGYDLGFTEIGFAATTFEAENFDTLVSTALTYTIDGFVSPARVVTVIPVEFVSGNLFVPNANVISINGVTTTAYPTALVPLGQISSNGNVAVSTLTVDVTRRYANGNIITSAESRSLIRSNLWIPYGTGVGLESSTLSGAAFIREEPSYTP